MKCDEYGLLGGIYKSTDKLIWIVGGMTLSITIFSITTLSIMINKMRYSV
jgi:hypothetical protein